jgi:DNA mismatch repair ATPase MutS
MIGQLVYLASLGLPIPAKTGRIFLPDAIYTHFERQEREVTANGKLQDDVERIYDILQQATTNSLIIINEMFASAVLKDSLCLGRKVMHIISRKDLYCVYVTFLEDLASFDEKTVSMVCTIAPDLKMRTYQIVRQPADGKAYAYALAARYNLGREDIIRRVLHESMSTGENG